MANETRLRLNRRGYWALEHAGELPVARPTRRKPLIRLWIYSTEGVDTSWTLLSPLWLLGPGTPVVREVLWTHGQDEHGLESNVKKRDGDRGDEPTLQVRDMEISAWDQDYCRDVASRLTVPTLRTPPAVPRWSCSGIEGYGSLASLRIEWRGAGPLEWSDVIRRVTELRRRMTGVA